MSDLILQWLNDEVQLSRKISNFEDDFQNGYLIGELLSKHNQQLNFEDFRDQNHRDSKINNFRLIFPTLNQLKIQFDSRLSDQIIRKERDVAKNLLYQIKMALEKVNNPADKLLGMKSSKGGSINPQKKITIAKGAYETMQNQFFKERLFKTQRGQQLIDQDRHLEKFKRFKE